MQRTSPSWSTTGISGGTARHGPRRAEACLPAVTKPRQMFFQGDASLGQRRMKLTRQSETGRYPAYRENARWTYADVMFITLHIIGSNNNLGRTAQMDAEYEERDAANIAWMREAFDLAARSGSRAVM